MAELYANVINVTRYRRVATPVENCERDYTLLICNLVICTFRHHCSSRRVIVIISRKRVSCIDVDAMNYAMLKAECSRYIFAGIR